MTSVFEYKVRVTSEKEITPNITCGRIRGILNTHFKDGKVEVELTGYSGSNSNDVFIAIVGSRRRDSDEDNYKVRETVRELWRVYKDRLVIVSGGCWGVDSWAEDEAKKIGVRVRIFRAKLKHTKTYAESVQEYYKRNKRIVEYATHEIIAFVAKDRTGGTENTIEHAQKLNRTITIR